MDVEPEAVRLSAHRQDARLGGHERRRARDPCSHLAQEGADRPAVLEWAPAPARRVGMGRGDGVADLAPSGGGSGWTTPATGTRRVWTVPARRTKTNRQHRVPLCGRALEILEAAQAFGEGAGPLVFTGRPEKPLDDKQLRCLLREHGIAAVPHGFRSTFRDWAAEETNHPREVIEAALAHVVQNRVEAAYARSDLFERRRILMDDWSRYLAQGMGEDSEP